MNKKQITYLIIFIAIFLIAIAGATYAFFDFGEVTVDNGLNLGTSVSNTVTFTAYSDGDLSLNMNREIMSKDASSTNAVATDNATVHVKMEGGSGEEITACAYDIIWVWDSEEIYSAPSVTLPYVDTSTNTTYNYEISLRIGGTATYNLSAYNWENKRAILETRSIAAGKGETKEEAIPILLSAYNLPVKQNDISGKIYAGHIEVSDARCSGGPTINTVATSGESLANAIKKLYKEDGSSNLYYHDGTGSYENADLEAGDGSYRFAGGNPANYVCFADDCTNYDNIYRIIGVFGDQVKLIKADYANSDLLGTDGDKSEYTIDIGDYSNYLSRGKKTSIDKYYWNKVSETNQNKWSDSELNKTNLNTNFYGSLGAKYQNMIADTAWVVSGFPGSENLSEDNNAKRTYDYEIAKECATCENKATYEESASSKIGLMYVSDYRYASEPQYWSLQGVDSTSTSLTAPSNDISQGLGENWLYTGIYEWTVSRQSDLSYKAFFVSYLGYVGGYLVYNNGAVRPSFYLKANVTYQGGSGTASDPIRIDYVPTASETIAASYTGQGSAAGENGVMYLHDSTLENGANDGSYRYAGADPDNYLCFEGDTCDDDHKYRIIGIFGENLKVIKMTSVGNKVWNSSNVNTWENSTMDTYLNGDWLTNEFGHSDLIEDYDWHVGGYGTSQVISKEMYNNEINSLQIVNRKVGLMYASDYGYGAANNYWATSLYNYDSSAHTSDWLKLGATEWIITPRISNSVNVLYIDNVGSVGHALQAASSFATRPTFYLKSSVEIKSGSGSKENPWIMGL